MDLIKGKMTFIVPTYHLDFDALRRLVATIQEYWQHEQIEEIIVILNDKYEYYAEFKSIVEPLKEAEVNLTMLWSNEIWPEQEQYDWYSQQMIKLIACDLVKTEWYLIHDTKDYYISPAGMENFVSPDGKGYDTLTLLSVHDINTGAGIFDREFTQSYKVWGLDFRDYQNIHTKWITPFLANTQVMKDMVSELKQMFGPVFYLILFLQLNHKPLFTEFSLYSGYLAKHTKLLELYALTPGPLGPTRHVTKSNKDLRRKIDL